MLLVAAAPLVEVYLQARFEQPSAAAQRQQAPGGAGREATAKTTTTTTTTAGTHAGPLQIGRNVLGPAYASHDHAGLAAPRKLCQEEPEHLIGLVPVATVVPELKLLEPAFLHVKPGGRWWPSHCLARHRVAVIVPYRDRLRNLRVFLHHMHQFLRKQELDYGIYIIEQSGDGDFNRAKLLNVGYEVSKTMHDYNCFIFHDVDLIPENDRSIYACQENPYHISRCLDIYEYKYLPLILKSAANLGGARSIAFRLLGVGVIQLLIGCVGAAPAVGDALAFGHAVTARQSHNVVEPSVGQRHATLARREQAAPRSEFCSVDRGQGGDMLKIQRKGPPLEELEKAMPHLKPGGRWFPTHCKARQRVALVVPYRDRLDNLRAFLQHMHPFLQRQQLDYAIYLVEQNGTGDFNRAKLLNVGYEIAKAMDDYDCFIFHDVDLLPENKRNEYACKDGGPLHMTTCLDYQKYKPFYATIFGGVCALRSDHMEKVNGFSNVFWGWGGEDDDMSVRLRFSGFNIVRNDCTVGRYTSLKHVDVRRNPERFRLLRRSFFRIFKDGLNTLQYSVLDIVFKKLYTHVIVDLSAHTASEPKKETRKKSTHK
ncbi:beta-1,4-galactosyltransferase 4-like isoform X6 [Dermacentor variabilis]|uniref:beta-1,4-galactosyltransferase 4-like isoform X6 n=1 Tax=Dermacentor variabilis TaxID=34621 RepID=UPI003F5C5999